MLFQILLIGEPLEAVRAGEVLLALVHPSHVVFQLTRNPEPFAALATAQLKHVTLIRRIGKHFIQRILRHIST